MKKFISVFILFFFISAVGVSSPVPADDGQKYEDFRADTGSQDFYSDQDFLLEEIPIEKLNSQFTESTQFKEMPDKAVQEAAFHFYEPNLLVDIGDRFNSFNSMYNFSCRLTTNFDKGNVFFLKGNGKPTIRYLRQVATC